MRSALFLISLVSNLLYSQNLEKFEPPDGRVIHGLGQYESLFYTDQQIWQDNKNYEETIAKVPLIYSVYASLDPVLTRLDGTDFEDITRKHEYPYILIVGLAFHDSSYVINGTFNLHVESIINGSLDNEIIALATRLKNVNVPVFLRPGFEFGINNAGFHNDPDMTADIFKNIWIHIYQVFATQDITNVAWVWNTVNPSSFNYMLWYPGDEYVDWFGINFFTTSQINGATEFVNDAKEHNKPVIVCESSPISSNGTVNTDNWDNWFVPYFNKIKSEEQIKGFVYINSPWSAGPFEDWPESRITVNSTISENFKQQLEDSIFIHMDEYLSNPGIINSINNQVNNPQGFDILANNYPNPFNAQTVLFWQSKTRNPVTINIYNILGERVDTFILKDVYFGKNEISWNAESQPSGIYYAKIKSSNFKTIATIKMSLIK